nr:hypothetical protein [Tanacetum cinerariifolium]
MLENSMYDSWASHIRLFIKGKKYAQQLQDDCDVQATNIIIHGLPPDVYALVNHQEAAKDIWDRVKLLMKGTQLSYQERECRLYNLFDKFAYVQGETLYDYYWRFSQLINDVHTIGMTMQQVQVNTKFLNALPSKWSKFVTDVKLAKSLYTTNYDQLKEKIQLNVVTKQWHSYMSWHQGEGHMVRQCSQPKRPRNAAWLKEKLMLAKAQEAGQILDEEQLVFLADPGISEAPVAQQKIPQNSAFQTKDLDAYDSDCDDLSPAKEVLIVNLSSCDPEVLSEVPYSDSYLNDMINQDVQEMQYSEQTHIDDFQDNATHNDKQAFWIKRSSFSETPVTSHTPVRIEALSELPKRTTSDAITADTCGFEHTKAYFVTEIIPFLKYTYNAFDKTLLDEITEVQTVFNQIESADNQCSVDKNSFEIQIKQLSIDNDQLLKQIMSQEIVHIAMNSVDVLVVKKSSVATTDDSPAIPEHTTIETPMNMYPENKAHFESEKEAIHLILTGIGDEIYSTVDACQTAQEIDPEQAQRDKDMQKNSALIAKYFKKIYKPNNNNFRTSSNSRDKNVDTTPRYKNNNQSRQFGNQRTINVAEARENVGSPVVQQSGIQCFNCKEFGHFAKECKKPKKVKDSAYHKEKMLLCKQAEKGEVPTAETVTDSEPLEQVQNDTRYNVFANDLQHSEQSES